MDLDTRDFFADRFTEHELRRIIDPQPIADFFSWASPSFRKLGVPGNTLDDDRLLAMMIEQPRLIRRPMIVIDGNLLKPMSGSERLIQMLISEPELS